MMKLTRIKFYNKNLKLNITNLVNHNFQRSVIIGLLLGDGSLYRNNKNSNARLELSFGSNYKDFALRIENIFKDCISNPLKSITNKDKIYINYRLKTKSLPFFSEFYRLFYSIDAENLKYRKIVPENILELLDPISLAYLIMSDGNFDKGRKRIRIYTNNFRKEEVELLAKLIYLKFDIYAGVLHDRKDQWIITIGAKYLISLITLVIPYFEESMLYRIGL